MLFKRELSLFVADSVVSYSKWKKKKKESIVFLTLKASLELV